MMHRFFGHGVGHLSHLDQAADDMEVTDGDGGDIDEDAPETDTDEGRREEDSDEDLPGFRSDGSKSSTEDEVDDIVFEDNVSDLD